MKLRDYQIDAIERLSRSIKQHQRSLLVAPTGAGKTVIASEIIRRCLSKNYHILFLAHRRELIEQCSDKLSALDVKHGIVKAGMRDKFLPHLPVQVASVQTLHRRLDGGRWKPKADVIICDEAHRIVGKTWRDVLDAYPSAKVIGLTATPYRTDGTGLGKVFNDLVVAAHIDDLIEQGHLINPRCIVGVTGDLEAVATQGGDYKPDDLSREMDTDALVGDIVESWKRYAHDTQTVLFACSIAHSKHFVERFRGEGVRVEHLDGDMSEHERSEILKRFRRREITMICNCNILTEGFDLPSLVTCVIARPTKSAGLYRQMIGRVMRPADGKTEAIILDHGGCIFSHGAPTARIEFTLDDAKKKRERMHICVTCFESYVPSDICTDDNGVCFAPCGHPHFSTIRDATDALARDPIKAEIGGVMIDLSTVLKKIKDIKCEVCKIPTRTWTQQSGKHRRQTTVHCTQCGRFQIFDEVELWKQIAAIASKKPITSIASGLSA